MPTYTPSFGPPAEDGTYICKIISCESKISRNGNTYLSWKLDNGHGVWAYLSTSFIGKGAEIFRSLVRAAKHPDYLSGPVNTDDLLGCFIQAECKKRINADGSYSHYLVVE